jgi:hypothetical protein
MRDKVQKYVHSPNRTAEWFWYARAYFDAAERRMQNALAYECRSVFRVSPDVSLREKFQLQFLA